MNRQVAILSLGTAVLVCTSAVFAEDRFVPGEYATIQAAINDCNDGDVVIVLPNTYTGPGNRDIDFLCKAITVRGFDPNDPGTVAGTIIDCNGTESEPHRGFVFDCGEEANSVVAGLTVINGYGPNELIDAGTFSVGGAVFCSNSSPTITKCRLKGNGAQYGGAIFSWLSNSSIDHCIIADNWASDDGAGVYCYESSFAVNFCAITGNSADGSGGGVCCWDGGLNMSNTILWGNTASSSAAIAGEATVSYCDVEGGASGAGNIDADPLLVDIENGDYHLLPWSPCIDAGDANDDYQGQTDMDGEARVIGTRVDIGADETDCMRNHPHYIYWVEVGRPACWCFPRQCHGDADGLAEGKANYWVYLNDLNILLSGWGKAYPAVGEDICADFSHYVEGKMLYRVYLDDLFILLENWGRYDVAPDCLDVPYVP